MTPPASFWNTLVLPSIFPRKDTTYNLPSARWSVSCCLARRRRWGIGLWVLLLSLSVYDCKEGGKRSTSDWVIPWVLRSSLAVAVTVKSCHGFFAKEGEGFLHYCDTLIWRLGYGGWGGTYHWGDSKSWTPLLFVGRRKAGLGRREEVYKVGKGST